MYIEIWQFVLALFAVWVFGGFLGILVLACCVASSTQGEIGRGDKK